MASPAEQYAAAIKKPARSKYGAQRCEVDGIDFASRREAKRYLALRILESTGDISSLVLQPRFPLRVNGELICTYVADFSYLRKEDVLVVEDVKGVRTDVYKIKRNMMKALYGLEVLET